MRKVSVITFLVLMVLLMGCDQQEKLIKSIDGTVTSYYANGEVSVVTLVEEYDDHNNVIKRLSYDDHSDVNTITLLEYDENNNEIKMTIKRSDDITTTFIKTYDKDKMLTYERYMNDQLFESRVYEYSNKRDILCTYYDKDHKITSIVEEIYQSKLDSTVNKKNENNQNTVNYRTYDKNGNLIKQVTDAYNGSNPTTEMTYDEHNKRILYVNSSTKNGEKVINFKVRSSYEYDEYGNMVRLEQYNEDDTVAVLIERKITYLD